MRLMSAERRRAASVGVLLAGYSALLGGLFGLAARPLIGVFLVLGGMALSLGSAHELICEKTGAAPESEQEAG